MAQDAIGVRRVVAGIGNTISNLRFLGYLHRAFDAIERILRALTALDPEPKERTHDPEDRIDGAISVFPIPQVITKPFDRCDRDPIQLVHPEYPQNVFVEPRSKIDRIVGDWLDVALDARIGEVNVDPAMPLDCRLHVSLRVIVAGQIGAYLFAPIPRPVRRS